MDDGRPTDIGARKTAILDQAATLGLDVAAVTRAHLPDSARRDLGLFLDQGRHGTMAWMAEHRDRRGDPRTLWPEAVSIVTLGMNYGPEDADPLAVLNDRTRAAISVYARGRDYHDVFKKRAKALARWMHTTFGADVKVFVDTAPVMEKPLAGQSGLGWTGKHTNLVSRRFGSWLFLGEVFTTLVLPPDSPETDHCGSCRRCLDVCPTGALDPAAPYRIDARLCVSYLTIEHKGPIPPALRARLGNRVYGCDDCLAVCPWNRFTRATAHDGLKPRPTLETAPRLANLAALDDAAFRALFSGSPIKRTGRDRFVRNVLIALGNSHRPDLLPVVAARLDDPSPLVRGAAVWAFRRLAPDVETVRREHDRRALDEPDPHVRAEWTAPMPELLIPDGQSPSSAALLPPQQFSF